MHSQPQYSNSNGPMRTRQQDIRPQQQQPAINQQRMVSQPHDNNSHMMPQPNNINHSLYNMPPQPQQQQQQQYNPPVQHQSQYMRPNNQPSNGYHPPSMVSPMPMPFMYSRTTEKISELVAVPSELSRFAAEPSFQQILLKVKEQAMTNYMSLNRVGSDCVESISIDAPSKESANLARSLIESHFKFQLRLVAAETRLKKVQTDLFSAQGEIASGLMIEFYVDPALIGLVLGKKGARIKQIQAETKVNAINVVGETGHIRIVGPDSESVQRAKELLELVEDRLSLQPHHAEWLSSPYNNSFLLDIRACSELALVKVNLEKLTLDVVGSSNAVRNARILLPTQLEYVEKQIVLEGTERQARQKLQEVRKQYGLRSGRSDYDRGEEAPQYNNNYQGNNYGRNRPGNDRPNPRGGFNGDRPPNQNGLNKDRPPNQNGLNGDRPSRVNNRSSSDSEAGQHNATTGRLHNTHDNPEVVTNVSLAALTKNVNAAAGGGSGGGGTTDGKPTATRSKKPTTKPTSTENKTTSTENKPISTENKPISAENKPNSKPTTVISELLANMKKSKSSTTASSTTATEEVVKEEEKRPDGGVPVEEGSAQTARDKSVAARNNARKEKIKPTTTTTTTVESLANSLKSVLNVMDHSKDKDALHTNTEAIAIVTDSSTTTATSSSNAIEAGASRPARDNKDRKPIKAPPTVSKGPKANNKHDTTDNSINNNNNSNSSSSSDAVVNKEVRRTSNKKAAAAPTDSTAATGTDSTDVKDGELNYEEPSLPRRSRQRKLPNAGGSGQDAPMEAPVTTTTAPVAIAPSSVVVGSKVVASPSTTTTASASPAKGVASHADHVLYEYNQQGQLLTNTTNFKEKMIMTNSAVMTMLSDNRGGEEVKLPLKSKAVGSNRQKEGIVGLTLKEAQQQILHHQE